MAWIDSLEELVDFLSMVIVCAPDDFPKEDYLCRDEQLTLEKAFDELRQGMQFVVDRVSGGTILDQLKVSLESAFASYKQGNDVKGAHLLQDFERMLLQAIR